MQYRARGADGLPQRSPRQPPSSAGVAASTGGERKLGRPSRSMSELICSSPHRRDLVEIGTEHVVDSLSRTVLWRTASLSSPLLAERGSQFDPGGVFVGDVRASPRHDGTAWKREVTAEHRRDWTSTLDFGWP